MQTEEKDRLDRIEAKLDATQNAINVLLSVIVIQQKDACEAAGITQETARAKVLRGELEVLQSDGSRLNYLKLTEVPKLKKRSTRK